MTAIALGISLIRLGWRRSTQQTTGFYATDCESDAGHAVMLTGMLIMFAAPRAPIPVSAWRSVFTIAVGCFAVLLVARVVQWRTQPPADRRSDHIAAAGYHLVVAAAMLYMTFGSEPMPAMPGMHHTQLPLPALAWALVVLLIADAIIQVVAATTLRMPSGTGTRLPPSIRIAVFPQTVMDVAMAIMLVAML
ncbi:MULTISPECIES: DUF5134 domain-containing protein [Mycobacterium]|uniref:DUF5134 domain-containing protein n=1 Tax=Mycobacterium TaxID=1763 RepID=UPI001301C3DA|nr:MULTISPECIES: DUF5134 domain-containing protein [Mycobacterium]MDA3660184.1 DUF5134 domain-containing protein [Mycobacterium xenopi]